MKESVLKLKGKTTPQVSPLFHLERNFIYID